MDEDCSTAAQRRKLWSREKNWLAKIPQVLVKGCYVTQDPPALSYLATLIAVSALPLTSYVTVGKSLSRHFGAFSTCKVKDLDPVDESLVRQHSVITSWVKGNWTWGNRIILFLLRNALGVTWRARGEGFTRTTSSSKQPMLQSTATCIELVNK